MVAVTTVGLYKTWNNRESWELLIYKVIDKDGAVDGCLGPLLSSTLYVLSKF